MPPPGVGSIFVSPTPVDFGNVITGSSHDLTFDIENDGDLGVTVDNITVDNGEFTFVGLVLPFTFQPADVVTVTLRYHPLSAGADTAVINIFHSGINTPYTISALGNAVNTGGLLGVDPSAWQFPDTKFGSNSAEKLFRVTNNGDANVTLNSAAVTTGFTLSTDPTPVTLTPGQHADIGVKFSPAASIFYYAANALAITNTGTESPFNVPLSGLGVPLISAFTVTGLVEKMLVGITDTAGVSSVNSMNPLIACEENCAADKQFDFWFPEADFPIRGYEKATFRIEIYYEDLGDFTIAAQLTSKRGIPSNQTLAITGVGDSQTKTAIFDLKMTDEIQRLVLSVSSGIASIVLILWSIQPGAEVVKNT